MSTTKRGVRWWVAAVCVPLLLASGCSDEPAEGDGDDSSSESASPSPSESETDPPDEEPTEPPVPEAMEHENKAGAKAFVEYYWDVVEHAQLTGDVSVLKTLSYPTCAACQSGIRDLAKKAPQIRNATGGDMTVIRASVHMFRAESERTFQVDYSVHNTRQVITLKSGRKEIYAAETSKYRSTVSLDTDGEWRMGFIEGRD